MFLCNEKNPKYVEKYKIKNAYLKKNKIHRIERNHFLCNDNCLLLLAGLLVDASIYQTCWEDHE